LAKDSTLASRLPREIELDDGTGTYDKIFRSGNALLVSVNEDKVGLLKEGGNVNVVNNPPNLDIPLSDHKDYIINALQPIRGTPVEDLSSYSIAAGEIKDITKSNLDGYSALMVTVKATYDPSATAGLRVRWLYSPDGTTFDSPEDAEDKGRYEDLTFDAGATRVRTILIPIFAPHVKIQLVNLDSTYAVTVSMWSWVYR